MWTKNIANWRANAFLISPPQHRLGERAEALFAILAKNLGWKVSPSSKDENIDEHWDFLIEKEDIAYEVEVESRKRISRDDDGTQSELTSI